MKTRWTTPFLFLLPAFLVYAVFVLAPIGESVCLSLLHWPSPTAEPVFCALRNFADLFGDRVFLSALVHNFLLLVLSLVIQLPLAAVLAILLSYPTFGRGFFRTVFFAPMIVPTVAVALLWQFVFSPGEGLLTRGVQIFWPNFEHAFLADPNWALFWVFITICWRHTGFHLVLFMAGIAGIPNQLYEAARLDGAGEFQLIRHVTLPLLRPAATVAATLSIIGSLKYFDLIYLMAEGVPEESREVMATYIYRLAFDSNQGRFGYGSAAAVLLLVVCLATVLPLQLKRRGTEG